MGKKEKNAFVNSLRASIFALAATASLSSCKPNVSQQIDNSKKDHFNTEYTSDNDLLYHSKYSSKARKLSEDEVVLVEKINKFNTYEEIYSFLNSDEFENFVKKFITSDDFAYAYDINPVLDALINKIDTYMSENIQQVQNIEDAKKLVRQCRNLFLEFKNIEYDFTYDSPDWNIIMQFMEDRLLNMPEDGLEINPYELAKVLFEYIVDENVDITECTYYVGPVNLLEGDGDQLDNAYVIFFNGEKITLEKGFDISIRI